MTKERREMENELNERNETNEVNQLTKKHVPALILRLHIFLFAAIRFVRVCHDKPS